MVKVEKTEQARKAVIAAATERIPVVPKSQKVEVAKVALEAGPVTVEPNACEVKVLAVFYADCKATKGSGTTLALVQGSSGKCRLYGKDSLANAFPDQGPMCRNLTSTAKMAEHFAVNIIGGKAACDKFMADKKLAFAGSEKIIADAGKGNSKRGGFRTMNYITF